MSTMRIRLLFAGTLLVGCAVDDADGSVPAVTPWAMESGEGDGVGPGTSSSPQTSSGSTSDAGETTAAGSTSSETTGGDDESSSGGSSESSSGGPSGHVVPCSLQAIDPDTDPATVIDYGDSIGQIPTEIGIALAEHCGCHYTNDIQIRGLTNYDSDAVPLSTWDDFHVPFVGVFPAEFDGTVWEATEVRVTFHQPLPMPPGECDIDGEGSIITEEDFALFAQWFDAGAPDGANWPP